MIFNILDGSHMDALRLYDLTVVEVYFYLVEVYFFKRRAVDMLQALP